MKTVVWRKPLMAAMCLAWLCLCTSAQAGDVCGTGGDCLEAQETAGCNDVDCCSYVCSIDSFCCDNTWDSVCAGEAAKFCVGCGDPGAGSCYVPGNLPGCGDSSCCSTVCGVDSFCCDVQWDSVCVDEAAELCGGCGVTGESCFVPHATTGCSDFECCASVCAQDSFCCDVEWDSICSGSAAQLCGNCGDPGAGNCYVPNGTIGCDNTECCATVCEADPFCCETEWDDFCASAAADLCDNCGNPNAGNCNEANGTPGCNNADCCATVCAADPFCCDVEWDQTCADAAVATCNVCEIQTASCFVEHASLGCNNSDCCATVCGFDPFCCDVEWDGLCVSDAIELCTPCGEPNSGSCFASHGNVGCADSDCCFTVCTIDTFCCEVVWDGICAGEAANLCEPCNSDCVTSETFAPPPDGKMDAADLAYLLGGWGACAGCCGDSVSSATFAPPPDGVIDAADLAFALGTWGNPACD